MVDERHAGGDVRGQVEVVPGPGEVDGSRIEARGTTDENVVHSQLHLVFDVDHGAVRGF